MNTPLTPPPPGLILFAHGARDPRWSEPFAEVAARIKAAQPQAQVSLAFLEFMSPSLLRAGQALAALGCVQIMVLPMFLGVGGHVRRDLPQMLDEMRAALPQCHIAVASAIGEDSRVMQVMAEVAAALLLRPPVEPGAA
jgi:sirohydrochlorin cobaltochelatase